MSILTDTLRDLDRTDKVAVRLDEFAKNRGVGFLQTEKV